MPRPSANFERRSARHCGFAGLPLCAFRAAVMALLAGCGINKSRLATEQLVVSEAVDKAVATIDFRRPVGEERFISIHSISTASIWGRMATSNMSSARCGNR